MYDGGTVITIYATINVLVFFCGVLVLMMQPGFMLLETGTLSRKNALNNIFKNLIDLCVCGILFFFIGYPIIDGSSPLIELLRTFGLANRIPAPDPDTIVSLSSQIAVFYNFVFAATAVTITSGSVTGRIMPFAYIFFGAVFSALVYPLVAFTVWNPDGLLFGEFGDFAGSAVVHAVGGFAGLAGAILLGPRIGEFDYGKAELPAEAFEQAKRGTQPHNLPLAALGVFLLWIGWYGFNAGSIFAAGYDLTDITAGAAGSGKDFAEAVFNDVVDGFGVVVLNTTLAPCAGVFVVFVFFAIIREPYHLSDMLNGALAGLVGVTACADIASPIEAIIVGMACAMVYVATTLLMARWRIDDPVNAFAVHGSAGVAAVALRGLFDDNLSVASQLAYGLGIAAFAFFSAAAVFMVAGAVPKLLGLVSRETHAPFPARGIRVSPDQELSGLDLAVHGERAYHDLDEGSAS